MPDINIPVPVVMLNAASGRFPTAVIQDEYSGGRTAVRLMTQSGVTDGIVLLGHNANEEDGLFRSETVARRIAGIRDEMAAQGLEFQHEISSWEWEPHNGYTLMSEYLVKARPQGLICLNDRLAFGAYQALGEAGLRVADEVGIVSFDNDELAEYLRPGLTTIALPHDAMGKKAVEVLLTPDAPRETILIPMQTVERSSLRKG